MNNDISSITIPYFEYNAINELIQAHHLEFGDSLKAVIAFGSLVTKGNTFDIDLLEVVQDWQGVSRYQASTTAELPLRGKLFLNILSDMEFMSFVDGTAFTEALRELRSQLLKGYEVVFEYPAGYAREVLEAAAAKVKTEGGGEVLPNPLRIPVGAKG